jgi:hypothetical protein
LPAQATACVAGTHSSLSEVQTLAVTMPQLAPSAQLPQSSVPPQPSAMTPQLLLCAAQLCGTQSRLAPASPPPTKSR